MNLIIETERLLLRPLLQSDKEAMFAMDSNPKVHQYLGNEPVTDLAQVEEYIGAIQNQYYKSGIGRFAVVIKDTSEIIGWSGLKFITEPENNHNNFYDLGYRLAEEFWGKGYATESAIAWRNYAFDVIKTPFIYASAHIDNIGSNTILQNVGMTKVEEYFHEDLPCNWYKMKNPKLI